MQGSSNKSAAIYRLKNDVRSNRTNLKQEKDVNLNEIIFMIRFLLEHSYLRADETLIQCCQNAAQQLEFVFQRLATIDSLINELNSDRSD